MRVILDSTPENGIAERLRLWRKTALELTQKEFAKATGVHLSAIRKYENRNSMPSSESLLAIASTGVDLHWLLTGEGLVFWAVKLARGKTVFGRFRERGLRPGTG